MHTDEDQKIADGINAQSCALVRPFVMMNVHLTPEEFEPVARARLKAYLDYHDAVHAGETMDEQTEAVDQLWHDGLWRAMWHEFHRIRLAGGGGKSSVN